MAESAGCHGFTIGMVRVDERGAGVAQLVGRDRRELGGLRGGLQDAVDVVPVDQLPSGRRNTKSARSIPCCVSGQ
jgi:hypothetical protein